MIPESGDLIHNRYRLQALLGQGGMGRIYRARDERLGRDVAVKIVSPSDVGTAGRARLMNEARAAAQLNHPNIVTIHDVAETDGSPFIVMELVEGASLHDRSPSTTAEIVRIAAQVCTGLEHAHLHGIVHRDLKPENVLVADDGTAKLTDFGLALSIASRTTSEGAITGTVFYLAPEQALGQPLDGRTDLYAVGVMLYELTAGRLPFVADDPLAVISQHLHAPPIPPSTYNEDIPQELEELILRLIAKRREDRPASAADVVRALRDLDLGRRGAGPTTLTSLLDRIARGRMVGREDELKQARVLWQRTASNQGQVLLISGEPGVGKTRLARELAAQVSVTGGTVLTGECYAEAGIPYAPIAQIIQQATNGTTDGKLGLPDFVLADLVTLAPALRARYDDIRPNPPGDPNVERQRLSESVKFLFASLAQQGPVLLILEDVHWADAASLSIVRHLSMRARSPDLRIMVVLTYREVELDQAGPLQSLLLDLSRERLATRIKLTRLTREQTGEMLSVLFQEDVTPDLLEGIYRETEGNPFFIEEVCKALIDEGLVTRKGGHWRRPDMAEVYIPQSVKIAIQSRLAYLPQEAREVLLCASILGREFDFGVLGATCDFGEERLIDALEAAERAQLITEVRGQGGGKPVQTFAFAHALIPHTLSESVSGLRRQRMHRRVAEALEDLGAERLDEMAFGIGRHFAAAGVWDKAADYLLRAGDHAQSLYAYQEAIRAYEEAVGFLREINDHGREVRTLMKLGSLYHANFDFQQARRAYQEGFALSHRLDAGHTSQHMRPTQRPLRMRWESVQSMDPARGSDVSHILVIDQLFAGLVEQTPEMDIVPDVAQSWEVLDGGRKYLFRLRPEARWSDGEPVTARDFEVAWTRVLDPGRGLRNARLLYDIKGARAYHAGENHSPDEIGIRAINPSTLSIELESPTGYFLHVLATATAYPIPAHRVEIHGGAWSDVDKLVNNGPFRLEEWRAGERIVLSRSQTYRGRFEGNLDRAELLFSEKADDDQDLRDYEADELAIAWIPEYRFDEFRHRHAGEYFTAPAAQTQWIWMNLTRPPFDDRRVRMAFVHACDREALAEVHLQGLDHPATGGLVPLGLPGHTPGIGLAFDPDRARALLKEAGYDSGEGFPDLEFLVPTISEKNPRMEYLCSQWEEVLGIRVEPEWTSLAQMHDRMRESPPDLARNAWLGDFPDPDNFLNAGLSFYGDVNWDPKYAALIDSAKRATDQQTRLALYAEADRLLTEEAALMPLTYGRYNLLLRPWVRRFPISPVKFWFLKDVVLDSA